MWHPDDGRVGTERTHPTLHLPPAEERGPYGRRAADLMSDLPVEFKEVEGFKEFKGFKEFAPMREQIL